MTVLSAIAQACTTIGLDPPTVVFGSTAREYQELASIANEMAQAMAFDGHDWTRLKSLATLTGDGVQASFEFPNDYRRMLKKARLWPSSTPNGFLTHYADTDQWLGDTAYASGWVTNGWTIIGDQIYVRPTIPNASTVQFYYLSSNYAKAADGTPKAIFDTDTDTFRLDERVLKLGIIWRWRASKGLPYAEDMQTYETALANVVGADKGSNIIMEGRQRFHGDVSIAYPWPLGV